MIYRRRRQSSDQLENIIPLVRREIRHRRSTAQGGGVGRGGRPGMTARYGGRD